MKRTRMEGGNRRKRREKGRKRPWIEPARNGGKM